MFSLKAIFTAGFHNRRKRQHSGIEAVSVRWNLCKNFQLLTSCSKKHIAFCSLQIFCCFFCGIHIYSSFVGAAVTKNPDIGNSCPCSCFTDIVSHFFCIRMGTIQNHFRSLFLKKFPHFFFCKTSCLYMKKFVFFQRMSTIFCSNTGKNGYLVKSQKTTDLISFCSTCKNDCFIHSCILLALPFCH